MTDSEPNDHWRLTDYLISLGMSRDDAKAWVRDRRRGSTFKADPPDGAGRQLNKFWQRKMQESNRLRKLKGGRIQQAHLLNRLEKMRMCFVPLSICTILNATYIIVVQVFIPTLPYWPVSVWLPSWITMQIFGEASLIASLVFGFMWAILTYSARHRRISTAYHGTQVRKML